ncbi:hypothetical protein MIND_00234700 [Mycena indigotica]|uniref:Uncharacterized protein n=1 Tax=Mycena indigotica TaxID=2126181 RepID=A0A8H6T8D0_9AGAR|nr:uncharacterized protein MIND_00234700 [Mycena indigotica]KAF7312217.1 hypothetical protein MIND_00234700 [Mycena indigotica]
MLTAYFDLDTSFGLLTLIFSLLSLWAMVDTVNMTLEVLVLIVDMVNLLPFLLLRGAISLYFSLVAVVFVLPFYEEKWPKVVNQWTLLSRRDKKSGLAFACASLFVMAIFYTVIGLVVTVCHLLRFVHSSLSLAMMTLVILSTLVCVASSWHLLSILIKTCVQRIRGIFVFGIKQHTPTGLWTLRTTHLPLPRLTGFSGLVIIVAADIHLTPGDSEETPPASFLVSCLSKLLSFWKTTTSQTISKHLHVSIPRALFTQHLPPMMKPALPVDTSSTQENNVTALTMTQLPAPNWHYCFDPVLFNQLKMVTTCNNNIPQSISPTIPFFQHTLTVPPDLYATLFTNGGMTVSPAPNLATPSICNHPVLASEPSSAETTATLNPNANAFVPAKLPVLEGAARRAYLEKRWEQRPSTGPPAFWQPRPEIAQPPPPPPKLQPAFKKCRNRRPRQNRTLDPTGTENQML